MVLVALGAVFGLLGLVTSVSHMASTSVLMIIWQLIWLAIYVWILMYLNRPDVKQAFGQSS
jgi:membrane associated rhomboid family serine protease